MPKRGNTSQPGLRKAPGKTSSAGPDSRSLTPKDIAESDATARDLKRRNLATGRIDDTEEREEDMLDDAVEMTFPASDPIAVHPLHKRHFKDKPATGRR